MMFLKKYNLFDYFEVIFARFGTSYDEIDSNDKKIIYFYNELPTFYIPKNISCLHILNESIYTSSVLSLINSLCMKSSFINNEKVFNLLEYKTNNNLTELSYFSNLYNDIITNSFKIYENDF